jgi:hypothetical protein
MMAAAIERMALDPEAWRRCQSIQAALVAEDCDPAAFEALVRRLIEGPEAVSNVIHLGPGRLRPEKRQVG